MTEPLFLVGAGFSVAANNRFIGDAARLGKRYPLAVDLAAECFGKAIDPTEIERTFAEALRSGDREPVRKLVKVIQTADYYLGFAEASAPDSLYAAFLDRFRNAHFLSFNYDALLELTLLKRGEWFPHDGFGVATEVGIVRGRTSTLAAQSSSLVLHLHGTTLLYPLEFDYTTEAGNGQMIWIKPHPKPLFVFDPDSLGHCFGPFERAQPGLGYHYPEQRIIAPVPDKADGLRAPYVRAIFERAETLVRSAGLLVAIGYRFADCDRGSFARLLKAAAQGDGELCIVAPDAADNAARVRASERTLRSRMIPMTFQEWARAGFPLR